MDFWNRSKHQQIVEPQTKRISTPAGQRLSVILENGDSQTTTRDAHRASARKSGMIATFGDAPRESIEDESQNSSGYSFSVWSDGEKKFGALRNNKQITKRGGWKRLTIIIGLILVVIIALAVGLAVGLKKKKSSSSNVNTDPQAAGTNPTSPASPTTTSISATSLPSNFPAGSYSMVTFLDTVQTNCTANPSTWTCYPYTDYNTSPSKSSATFNWIISGSPGSYKISSTENPFSIEFKNADLKLLDEGKDSERYRFQLSETKTVSPTESLTEDNDAAECDFDNTSMQAYLYTKMEKTYPNTETGDGTGNPSFPVWPFAVRFEQAAGGGQDVPSCYKMSNGVRGDQITDGLEAQDAGNLCSCLYKNWRTPTK